MTVKLLDCVRAVSCLSYCMGSNRVFAGLRRRWAPAKLFNEQLSKLAESEQNIRHLNRLQGLIEDGMALQVRAPCEGVRLFSACCLCAF